VSEHELGRSVEPSCKMYVDLDTRANMNVGLSLLFVLDRVLSEAEVRSAIARLQGASPRFSQILEVGFPPPKIWSRVREFDANKHVNFTDLSAETDLPEVLRRCSVLQEGFNYRRPLWRSVYFSPLTEGRSAIFLRIHHAFGDGAAIRSMMLAAFGTDGAYQTSEEPAASRVEWAVRASVLGAEIRTTLRGLRVAVTDLFPASSSSQLSADRATLRSREDNRRGRQASSAQTMALIDGRPSKEWVDQARARSGWVNDLFVKIVSQTMHDYWNRSGAPKTECIVAVPVDMKRGSGAQSASHAVHVKYIPVRQEHLAAHSLRKLSGAVISAYRQGGRTTMDDSPSMVIMALLPSRLRAHLYARGSAMTDSLASNVGRIPSMRIGDASVEMSLSFAPAIATFASFVLQEYNEKIYLCANIDNSLVPDRDVFTSCAAAVIRRTFDQG